jgi:hypothetical protein
MRDDNESYAGAQGGTPVDAIMEVLLKALIETGGRLDRAVFMEDVKDLVGPDEMKQVMQRAKHVFELYEHMTKPPAARGKRRPAH